MDRAVRKLIVVGGPTASGKTALAIRLAQRLGTAVVSADSRQFYREMNIGVARPSEAELAAAPHYFIADRSVVEPLTAGQYAREALALLDVLFLEYEVVVVVGGSGLYIRALTEGFDVFPETPEVVKEAIRALYAIEGLAGLQAALQAVDPAYYDLVDRQNPARLMRALEVCQATGQPYSSFRSGQRVERPFRASFHYIDWPREELYERINRRVDMMFEQGLEAEAKLLHPLRHLSPLQTVGYQELFDYFEGKHDLETARERIRQHSRQYAKRQLTWLRRDGYWQPWAPGFFLSDDVDDQAFLPD